MSEMDDTHSISWIPVPNTPYIMKYVFYDYGYEIMASNLTSLYSEKLANSVIMKRFCELNPFVQSVKVEVILDNLKMGLKKGLAKETELSADLISDKLVISLEYAAGIVEYKYNFQMDLLNAEKVTEYIICPTIFNALLAQRKILDMQKKIIAFESAKSQSASSSSITVQDPINPDWLKGKNVPKESLLESFIKVQSFCKDLEAENHEAYRKEELKKHQSTQSMSANKKFKSQEKPDDESNSIKFEESDERTSIKKEEAVSSDSISSQMKSNVKKKKGFKI